jgi:hypothetical protein
VEPAGIALGFLAMADRPAKRDDLMMKFECNLSDQIAFQASFRRLPGIVLFWRSLSEPRPGSHGYRRQSPVRWRIPQNDIRGFDSDARQTHEVFFIEGHRVIELIHEGVSKIHEVLRFVMIEPEALDVAFHFLRGSAFARAKGSG